MTTRTTLAVDALSFGTVIATIAGWLPPIAALFSIVWLGMQMYVWIVNKKWRSRHLNPEDV